jgi:hypothetical protein
MNENPLADVPHENPLPLACTDRVYRAALDPTWFSQDGTRVDQEAFYRRRGRADAHGVSIGVAPHSYQAFLREPIAGVISVHVGHVRDVVDPELLHALDVEINDHPHGNIINVPPKEKSGPRRKFADRIASLLARTAARPHEIFNPMHN